MQILTSRLLLGPMLALAAVAATAHSASAALVQGRAVERIHELLRAQAAAGHGVDRELLEELREPAHAAPETVVELLFAGQLPPIAAEQRPSPINVYQRELALEALAGIDPERVEVLLPPPRELVGDEQRLATGMRLIAWTQPPTASRRLVEISQPPADEGGVRPLRSTFLRGELRACLARMIERDPDCAKLLLGDLLRGSTGDRAAILGALGDAADPRVLPLLLEALDARDVDRALVLTQVARIGRSFDFALDGRVLASVRSALHVGDERVVVAAARALAALDDTGAIPALVERLSWAEESQDAIQDALRELSAVRLPNDPEAWRRYAEAESAWADGPMQRLQAHLRMADAAELIELVRPLSTRRQQRDPIAASLVVRLTDGHRPVRSAAATALGQLGSPLAIEALVAALERDPTEPSYAAALARITGCNLGSEFAAWSGWLAGRRPE